MWPRRRIKTAIGHLPARLALGLAVLASVAETVSAQEAAKPIAGTWRPKDGIYAVIGPDFTKRCGEFGDTQIDWKENYISGGEEGCKIIRTTTVAPGDIRLDVSCTDNQRETPYKEIIQLKKINETTFFLRETQNGKFTRPGGRFVFCPAANQQAFINSMKKAR